MHPGSLMEQVRIVEVDRHVLDIFRIPPDVAGDQRDSPPCAKFMDAAEVRPQRQRFAFLSRRDAAGGIRARAFARLIAPPLAGLLRPRRFAPERLGAYHAIITVPRRAPAEDIGRGAAGCKETDQEQRRRAARFLFESPYQVLIEFILGHGPQQPAYGCGDQLHIAGVISALSIYDVTEVVPDNSDAGFPKRPKFPLKVVRGRERQGAHAALPVSRLADLHSRALGIVLNPEGIRDASHEGMTHVLVQERITVIPILPGPFGIAVPPPLKPFTVRCLPPVPISGVEIPRILKGIEERCLDDQLAPVNATLARMARVCR